MVDSRLNSNPPTLFHCFAKVPSYFVNKDKESSLNNIFPKNFDDKDGVLKQIPTFCFPCAVISDGVQYSTFVLTDLDSKFRFGFCRYPPNAVSCLCIISYMPWFETFYTILNKLSSLPDEDCVRFLELLYCQSIPNPGTTLAIKLNVSGKDQTYSIKIADTRKLPSIPENRNLTEYYAKIQPMNMIYLFVSMLFERRIIVTSEKLSLLTAVVHGSVALLYPMQWQHIFVPILPPHLLDYCCAPMPFLLGIHSSMMAKVRQMPMNEVVILNADTNEIEFDQKDMECFPSKITKRLHKHLQRTDKALNKYVSQLFLKALADLIGGYRDALKFIDTPKGGRIVFDDEMFLNTRVGSMKVFLDQILDLQSFRQFIAGRLDMLNDGVDMIDIFEQAVIERNAEYDADIYGHWREKMKKGGGALKKSVEGKYGYLKDIVNEIEVKEMKKKLKTKVKDGYKGIMKMTESKKMEETETESVVSVKRINTMPNSRLKINPLKADRHSLYATFNRKTLLQPAKTPPPRPPQPLDNTHSPLLSKETSSLRAARKDYSQIKTNVKESHSDPNISNLIDISSPESSQSGSSENVFIWNGSEKTKKVLLSKELLLKPVYYSEKSIQNSQKDHFEIYHATQDSVGIETHCPKTYSEPNVNAFIDMSSSESSVEDSSDSSFDSNPIYNNIPKSKYKTALINEDINKNLFKEQCGDDQKTTLLQDFIIKSTEIEYKKKPKIAPPPRPPPFSTPIKSRRPPVINGNNFDTTLNNEDITHNSQENCPFYKPSSDLLELDSSLFQDTLSSLSADARKFVTSPQISRRSLTKDQSDKSDLLLSQNKLQENNQYDECRNTLIKQNEFQVKSLFDGRNTSTKQETKQDNSNNIFADCFQTAKSEFELKKKSEDFEKKKNQLINELNAETEKINDFRKRQRSSNSAKLLANQNLGHYEEV